VLKTGDKVVMHTCGEAYFPQNYGKVWTCRSDEEVRNEGEGIYEQRVVFLEGFSGCFATKYLQKVNAPNDEQVKAQEEKLEIYNKYFKEIHDLAEEWSRSVDHETMAQEIIQVNTSYLMQFAMLNKEG